MLRSHSLLLLVFVASTTVGPAFSSPFRVGELAPDMTLPSIADGSRLSLSDFRGRRLMLHVWASW